MSFVDKVIHTLDSYTDTPYFEDEIEGIKKYIKVLINTRGDEVELLSLSDLNISAKNLAVVLSEKIYSIIATYERRIKIVSIEYDESFAPWQLIFFIRFHYYNDKFREYGMQITFKNNRYCEIT